MNVLRRVVPQSGKGIEIGAGTGRFSRPLGIKLGVDTNRQMALISPHHGLKICQATGERLPFSGKQFDHVLLVTVICFIADMLILLQEIHRVLAPGGLHPLPPQFTETFLQSAAARLRKTNYQVTLTPFGWLCEWDLSVYGESLAKVFKSL